MNVINTIGCFNFPNQFSVFFSFLYFFFPLNYIYFSRVSPFLRAIFPRDLIFLRVFPEGLYNTRWFWVAQGLNGGPRAMEG